MQEQRLDIFKPELVHGQLGAHLAVTTAGATEGQSVTFIDNHEMSLFPLGVLCLERPFMGGFGRSSLYYVDKHFLQENMIFLSWFSYNSGCVRY